eukprot:8114730-Pyramimonas_sp.AAC.1
MPEVLNDMWSSLTWASLDRRSSAFRISSMFKGVAQPCQDVHGSTALSRAPALAASVLGLRVLASSAIFW